MHSTHEIRISDLIDGLKALSIVLYVKTVGLSARAGKFDVLHQLLKPKILPDIDGTRQLITMLPKLIVQVSITGFYPFYLILGQVLTVCAIHNIAHTTSFAARHFFVDVNSSVLRFYVHLITH